MPYEFALADCFICGCKFDCNPDLVPCVMVAGRQQPLCRRCIDLTNIRRRAAGLAMVIVPEGAYIRPDSDAHRPGAQYC